MKNKQHYNIPEDFDNEYLADETFENLEDEFDEFYGEEEDEETLQSFEDLIYSDFENKLNAQEEEIIKEAINDIDLSTLPTPLEQAVQDYQDGIDEAFDYIYNYYKPKLERLGYRKNDDELMQELTIVLLRAIKTFKLGCGAKFNTYYWKCARNHMGTLNIRKNAKKRTAEFGTISMQQPFSPNSHKDSEAEISTLIKDSESEMSYDKRLFHMVLENDIFPHLKQNEINAIKLLLSGCTLEEIGAELDGITAPAVHVKFRRLAEKKIVGKQLKLLYENFSS